MLPTWLPFALAFSWVPAPVPSGDILGFKIQNPSGSPSVLVGTIPIYIIWYQAAGTPWSTAAKKVVRDYINGLGTQTYGTSMWRAYPNAAGTWARSFNVAAECTDNLNEGTGVGACGSTVVFNNVTPSGCALPNDPTGIYVTLPGNGTGLPAGVACHANTTVSAQSLNNLWATSFAPNTCGGGLFQCATPSGVRFPEPNAAVQLGLDAQITLLDHEMLETVSNPYQGNGIGYGWEVTIASQQTEVCDTGFGAIPGPGLFASPTGAWANAQNNGSYFVLPACWVPGPSNVMSTSGNFPVNPTNGAASSCNDGVQDGFESDVDCGFSCVLQCMAGAQVACHNYSLYGGGSGYCPIGLKCATEFDCDLSFSLQGGVHYRSCVNGVCSQ